MKDLLNRLNDYSGRKVYSLPTGLVTNTVSRAALWRARSNYPDGQAGFRLPTETFQYLNQNFSQDVVDELRDAVEVGFQSEMSNEKRVKDKLIQKSVSSKEFNFQKHFDLRKIFTEDVKREIEDYFGSYFAIDEAKAYRSFHIPPKERKKKLTTYNWHMDFHPPTSIKLFVLLSDVTEENGPTEIADKPPTEYSKADRSFSKIAESSPDNTIKMTGDAGSAYLFCPSRRLHRAGYVDKDETRDLIFFRLVPSSKPLDSDWPNKDPYADSGTYRTTAIGQFTSM